MCGIFGLISQNEISPLKNIDTKTILHHRGPDDSGWLMYDGREVLTGKSTVPDRATKLLLLHKRLSILDLSEQGWQPMSCEGQRYFILFNGEIYNYLELKKELQQKGFVFTSKSDSEVLLKAYIYWGSACLKKLEGMFAFVIFDRQLEKVFFARDAFGIKPFYYFVDDNRLLFSSEIKSLLNFLPKNKINTQRLFFYLRSGLTDFTDETLFAGIKQLPAAHFLEIDINNFASINPVSFWSATININKDISFTDAAQRLREIFLSKLSLHARSDVPIAATLSGGIDSSSIVMGLRHLYPELQINTFSYIADDPRLSEEKWVDIVNREANATGNKVTLQADNFIADLEHLIRLQDEPFGSTSIYAQQRVFQDAKKFGIKVMLDGQGADEMLGGYTFYLAARFVSHLKQFKFHEAMQLLKNSGHSKSGLILNSFKYLLPSSLQMSLRKFTNQKYIPDWLNDKWFTQNDVCLSPLNQKYSRNVLHDELMNTFTHTSLPMLLRFEDRNSMAQSIESRVPFLTIEMVNFVFSLPEDFLISNEGVSKAVFREAMRGIVPDSILNRRDKIGFATPERNLLFLLKPWIEKTLMSDYVKNLPMFNYKKLMMDWQLMLQGRSHFDSRYWRWINFIKWSEAHQIEM